MSHTYPLIILADSCANMFVPPEGTIWKREICIRFVSGDLSQHHLTLVEAATVILTLLLLVVEKVHRSLCNLHDD